MNTFNRAALALVAAACFASQANAATTTVLDTGKPSGGVVGALSIDAVDWMAESFTLSSKTTIDSVLTYVQSTAFDEGQGFTVALYAATSKGGALVPAINFFADQQGQLQQFSATFTGNGGWIGQSGLNWTLDAGTYFIAVETDGNGVQGLVLPTGGLSRLPGAVAYYTGGSGYDADPSVAADAFGLRVTAVSAVPEPASMALMLLGMAGVAAAAGRRRSNNDRS
ncbi:PEP-CTERM sorting domain-containing protein [Pelomonas sp. KK5]|uniref:PEP-CTERM sorting domain-containing protein n=1 Tax=Pelomonas sp. KK5 TaxID=1855730 RepID=UPI00097BC6AE|nr:PEP-CTERM sorting domain-containing protein [Pelomonas sp. KK5]